MATTKLLPHDTVDMIGLVSTVLVDVDSGAMQGTTRCTEVLENGFPDGDVSARTR